MNGFNFGASSGGQKPTATTQSAFNFGTPAATQQPATGLGSTGFGAVPFTGLGAATGFNAKPVQPATTAAAGLSLGLPATSTSGGFNLGLKTTTATTAPNIGLGGFGAKTSAPLTLGSGLGGLTGTGPATTVTTGNLGLGGLGATTTTASTGLGGFGATSSAAAVSSTSRGLGGVDPKTTTAGTGTGESKPCDGKALKESNTPQAIAETVEKFRKYLKEQKAEREEIARMSSTPMVKVQEEAQSLQQLLSLVTNSLHRNAVAIKTLKQDSAQELKHVEIAQRTKDTPAGLQYENTAPSEYFARLVDDFACRMVLYRQQIEEMESHLVSAGDNSLLTPQELAVLLTKLHDNFVNLAAQLQSVNEAVKQQKDFYLNYRKVFHGDTTDVFEKRRKVAQKSKSTKLPLNTAGPTPFAGMSNVAAIAMASALNRTQPSAPAAGAPTFGLGTGLGAGSTLGSGLGTTSLFNKPATGSGFASGLGTTGTGFSGFGNTSTGGLFGGGSQSTFGSTNTAAIRPLGFSGFGNTGTSTASNFGGFGSSTTGFGGLGAPSQTLGQPSDAFQLQPAPSGKRGKKS